MIWEIQNPDERKEFFFEEVASLGKEFFQKLLKFIEEASISKIDWIGNFFYFLFL